MHTDKFEAAGIIIWGKVAAIVAVVLASVADTITIVDVNAVLE